MKKEKDCGCTKCKKTREILGVSECFGNKTNFVKALNEYTFQKNKPFKVTFNEGIDVSWTKLQEKKEPKKLTKRDKMQKEAMVKKLKQKGTFEKLKKQYGKRAKGVAYAIATKKAKETP